MLIFSILILSIIFLIVNLHLYIKKRSVIYKMLTIVVSLFSMVWFSYTVFAFLDDGLIDCNITEEDIFSMKSIELSDDWFENYFTDSEIEYCNDSLGIKKEAKKDIVNNNGYSQVFLDVLLFDDEESALNYYTTIIERPYEIIAVDETYNSEGFNYMLSFTSYSRADDPLFYGLKDGSAYNTRLLVRSHNAIFDFSEISHSKQCSILEVIDYIS